MKKLSLVMISIGLASVMYAQRDTIPPPVPIDTFPPGSNTTDTFGRKPWNNADTTSRKPQWDKDTVSAGTGNWNNRHDSGLTGNNNGNVDQRGNTMADTMSYPNSARSAYDTAKRKSNGTQGQAGTYNRKDTVTSKAETSGKLRDKQDPVANGNTETKPKKVSDRIAMKDGDMVIVKNGQEQKITKNTVVQGMTVMADGTIKMPDGKTAKLKDGQYIELTKPSAKSKKG